MLIKQGIPVSPGIAICPAFVLESQDQPVRRRHVTPTRVAAQHEQLDIAIEASIAEIETLRDQASAILGEQMAAIFAAHIGMLRDQSLIGQIRAMIDTEHWTVEYAVETVFERLAATFARHQSPLLQQRVSDLRDLKRRLIRHIIGDTKSELDAITSPVVVVAHDLTPSQTAALDKTKIKALITDLGGRTSHTAILAHALGIPAIVGLENATGQINTGDSLIVDGHRGLVISEPDGAKLMEYRQELRRAVAFDKELDTLAELPAVTKDGTEIQLVGNIEFPEEIPDALAKGAQGIGLYRTEFLYLASDEVPGEEEQYEAYVKAIRLLGGRTLTFRTLDLGADKLTEAMVQDVEYHERNPFLGCRSIRLCLQNLPLFRTQLKAILRASTEGPVRIMFPLVSAVMELRQAKMVLMDVMEDLDDQGIDYAANIPIGMMIEVPSAALQAVAFAREADFFSIGTNDLIQYTVAVDRSNERIANLYSAAHPAVIQLIKEVVRASQRGQTPVSLCGEMAGEPEFAMLLMGLGLRTLSITPPAIPEIKKIIRSVSLEQCKRVARKVSQFESERQIHNYLRSEVTKIMPEAFEGRSLGY